MLELLRIAPLKDSYDFFILMFLYLPSILWIRAAYKASRSGSIAKIQTWYRMGFKYVPSDENVPFFKQPILIMFCLHIFFLTLMLLLIGDGRWEVWFI
jgi:hypothetical protein